MRCIAHRGGTGPRTPCLCLQNSFPNHVMHSWHPRHKDQLGQVSQASDSGMEPTGEDVCLFLFNPCPNHAMRCSIFKWVENWCQRCRVQVVIWVLASVSTILDPPALPVRLKSFLSRSKCIFVALQNVAKFDNCFFLQLKCQKVTFAGA